MYDKRLENKRISPKTGSDQSGFEAACGYLAQMIFDLFKDGVSFESLQIVA